MNIIILIILFVVIGLMFYIIFRTKQHYIKKNNTTIGILSWKAYDTLENTLNSYKINNLYNNVDSIIYFQEFSDMDEEIANEYNIPYIYSDENTGIIGGFIDLVKNTKTKYFIFAENDFELVHDEKETIDILSDTINLLDNYDVQIVKLRDRKNYGEPLYSINASLTQDCTLKLETLHFLDEPEKQFPNSFDIIDLKYRWYKCSNVDNQWSNNIFIAKTEWLMENVISLLENSDKTDFHMENFLIRNLKNYNVAAGIGLFKHNRLD